MTLYISESYFIRIWIGVIHRLTGFNSVGKKNTPCKGVVFGMAIVG